MGIVLSLERERYLKIVTTYCNTLVHVIHRVCYKNVQTTVFILIFDMNSSSDPKSEITVLIGLYNSDSQPFHIYSRTSLDGEKCTKRWLPYDIYICDTSMYRFYHAITVSGKYCPKGLI